jgi:hypothetical protein
MLRNVQTVLFLNRLHLKTKAELFRASKPRLTAARINNMAPLLTSAVFIRALFNTPFSTRPFQHALFNTPFSTRPFQHALFNGALIIVNLHL